MTRKHAFQVGYFSSHSLSWERNFSKQVNAMEVPSNQVFLKIYPRISPSFFIKVLWPISGFVLEAKRKVASFSLCSKFNVIGKKDN